MQLLYMATPYSHPDESVREKRYKDACVAMAKLMTKGYAIYAPIVQTHPVATSCGLALDFKFWENFDKEILSRCDGIIIVELDGWMQSVGVKAETEIARELGFPIKYFNPETEEISPCPTANFQKTHSAMN